MYYIHLEMLPWPSDDLVIVMMMLSYFSRKARTKVTISCRIYHMIPLPGTIILYQLELYRHKEHVSPMCGHYCQIPNGTCCSF